MKCGARISQMDFPFELAVKLDLPDAHIYRSGKIGAHDMDCPFCGGHKKFNFIGSVGHCNKCDRGFNTVTFHAELTGLSTKEAYADLKKAYYNLPREEREKSIAVKQEVEQSFVPAPLSLRDLFYRSMIDESTLASKHREDLHDRGLTDADIEKYRFVSVPMVGRKLLTQKIENQTGIGPVLVKYMGTERMQIPGVVDFGANATLIKRSRGGFLIPIVWYTGEISGFQVRNDQTAAEKKARKEEADRQQKAKAVVEQICREGGVPTKEQLAAVKPLEVETPPKYSYYSSGSEKYGTGCSDIENIHFVGDGFDFKAGKSPELVCLTEGCLKADVAAALSGQSFIGVLGVNMQRCLPDALGWLKRSGTKRISVCFDMDMFTNVHVMEALVKLVKRLEAAGYPLVFTESDFQHKQAKRVAHALNKTLLTQICADHPLVLADGDGEKVKDALTDLLACKVKFGPTDCAKLAECATRGMNLSADDMVSVQKYAMALVRKAQSDSKPYLFIAREGMPECYSRIALWDPHYKGIDDYLLAQHKKKGRDDEQEKTAPAEVGAGNA